MTTPTTYAVALADVRTVLFAHKLRRRADGKMASLAVMTAAPLLDVDCGAGLRHLHGMRADAMRIGRWKSRMQPLQRGHIARLFDRVQATGHRREVQRTWHTGIGQLRREPRFVLHLPLLCQVQQQHKPFRQWPTQARTVAATAALALLAACGGGGAQDPENAAPGTATTQPVNCTATPKACA